MVKCEVAGRGPGLKSSLRVVPTLINHVTTATLANLYSQKKDVVYLAKSKLRSKNII